MSRLINKLRILGKLSEKFSISLESQRSPLLNRLQSRIVPMERRRDDHHSEGFLESQTIRNNWITERLLRKLNYSWGHSQERGCFCCSITASYCSVGIRGHHRSFQCCWFSLVASFRRKKNKWWPQLLFSLFKRQKMTSCLKHNDHWPDSSVLWRNDVAIAYLASCPNRNGHTKTSTMNNHPDLWANKKYCIKT